ncbi:unnamed protein product [Urochloa humidicola]
MSALLKSSFPGDSGTRVVEDQAGESLVDVPLAGSLVKNDSLAPSPFVPVSPAKDPLGSLEKSLSSEENLRSLEIELAECQKRNADLEVKYEAVKAARAKSIKDHAEATEQIMRSIDISADIDLLKVTHASEVRALKWQIQNLENELIRTQGDRDSWKTGGFRIKEENERLEIQLKNSEGSYNAVKADFEAIVKRYEELEAAVTVVADSIDPASGEARGPLVDRLQRLPEKFAAYVQNTCSFVTSRVLAAVRFLNPNASLDRVPAVASEDDARLEGPLESMKLLADQVVSDLDLS